MTDSIITNGLALHLRLDEIVDQNVLIDASGNGNSGTINGMVQLVPDEQFGSSVLFDSSESLIEVADADALQVAGDFTIDTWVYIATPSNGRVRIVGKGDAATTNYGLWYDLNANEWIFRHTDAGTNVEATANGSQIETDTWYHLAGVRAGNQAILYLNGQQVATTTSLTGPVATTPDALTIGFADFAAPHNGKVTNVRLYRRALSAAEIQRNMEDDQTAFGAFQHRQPIDFRLYDEEDQAILAISDDPAGQNLQLIIRNTAAQDIELQPLNATSASADNHHFALWFRPGTVSANTVEFSTVVEEGWATNVQQLVDGTVVYYLLRTTPQTIAADRALMLTLQNMSAAPGTGARGTRVELRYRQLTHVGEATELSGSRLQHLSIVNRQGRQNIPLHIGFIGSNKILNDGTSANTLDLRITNTLVDDVVTFSPETDVVPTRLVLSFDVQPDEAAADEEREWALGTTSQVAAIQVAVTPPGWTIRQDTQGISPEWVLNPQAATTLESGEHIQITLSDIISSLPTGHTNLYLQYENIPGYVDGKYIVVIEKGPVVYREGNVGIGTIEPAGKLTVQADHTGAADAQQLIIQGAANPEQQLELGYHTDNNYGSVQAMSQEDTPRNLALNPLGGRVGVGTPTPRDALGIRAIGQQEGLISFEDPNGRIRWHLEQNFGGNTPGLNFVETGVADGRLFVGAGGRVGVNTLRPETTLDVNGEIRSRAYQFLANSLFNGQSINRSGEHIMTFIRRQDPFNVFNNGGNFFTAPTAGYYFFSTSLTFGSGNGTGDGVIFGIFRAGNANDPNTVVSVLEPGRFTFPVSQSLTAMMELDQGDRVDVRLQGVDTSRFLVSNGMFAGYLITK